MIEIDNSIYNAMASELRNSINEYGFVNRTFSINVKVPDNEDLTVSLTISALDSSSLKNPVWWVCNTICAGKNVDNDFSYREFFLIFES